ncbi:MAG: TetR family transcriptional regulator [Burkholderiaceae bacterium]
MSVLRDLRGFWGDVVMVRKAKGESQATYDALLDAAEREFSDKGVTRTTLNDVARAAGMTRGAIYWHFKDKSALIEAMCDRVFLPMQALLNEIAATPNTDPLAAIRQMMLHMLIQVASDLRQRTVFDIMFHHCEKDNAMAFFASEKQKRCECLSKMEALIGAAVACRMLPAQTDTALAMQALNSYLIGLIYEWLIDPQAYDLKRHAEPLIDCFLAGMVARPPLLTAPAERSGGAAAMP